MRAGLVVTGVLGAGTALVFCAAALVATLFPNGTMVAAGWNGGWAKGGVMINGGVAVPMPAPIIMPGGAVPAGGGFLVDTPATIESPQPTD